MNIPLEKRPKAFKIKPYIQIRYLVGYEGENSYLFYIYNPTKNKVSIYRDIVFQEYNNKPPKDNLQQIIDGFIQLNLPSFEYNTDPITKPLPIKKGTILIDNPIRQIRQDEKA